MKKVFIILLTVTIYGCNSHLDKKIFEPLTVEEIKKSIDKDSTFQDTYETIQFIKDSVLKSDIEKAKFADLTYNRVKKLIKFSNDTTYFKPIREQLKKEWQDKYGVLHTKVDSISNYWKKYRDENSLEQYVKVELIQIDKEYYSYSYGIKNVNLGFRLTPLKGQVDQLRFGYRIDAKINEKEEDESSYLSLYSALDKSWCLTTTPFSKPTVRYWEANYTNEKILQSKTIETFFRDYNIQIEIDQLRKDGKNMSNDDLQIPKSVKYHWEYENKEYLKDLYVKDILKDILNIEYIPDYEYISDGISKKLKDKDALAYEFLTSNRKKK
jgi:hypothetical protein